MARRYLLDTHVFLSLADPTQRRPRIVEAALAETGAEIFLSVVTVAEACIKHELGKLQLPPIIAADAVAGFRAAAIEADFTILPITLEHAARLKDLPRHHRDPFDRLLISQALCEGLVLVSSDRAFPAYHGLALLRP